MWWFSIAMVIFYSYVGLPEGVYIYVCVCLFFPVIDTQQETLGVALELVFFGDSGAPWFLSENGVSIPMDSPHWSRWIGGLPLFQQTPVGGLELFIFSHILGRIIPTD